MPLLAEEQIPIPTKDILSWTFDQPQFDHNNAVRDECYNPFYHHTSDFSQIYIDAENPSNCISAAQAQSVIRQLIAGFRHAGLRKGDTVLLHSFNSIYYPIVVLGLIGFGAIYTGSNPGYTTYEVRQIETSSRV